MERGTAFATKRNTFGSEFEMTWILESLVHLPPSLSVTLYTASYRLFEGSTQAHGTELRVERVCLRLGTV